MFDTIGEGRGGDGVLWDSWGEWGLEGKWVYTTTP